jgi:alpha-galactosidase
MITYNDKTRSFLLTTPKTAYALHIAESGHLLHLYYGTRLPDNTDFAEYIDNLRLDGKPFVPSTHASTAPNSFDIAPQEFPVHGRGDFREPCLHVTDGKGMSCCELTYVSHEIYSGKHEMPDLPSSYADDNDASTLEITLHDALLNLQVKLIYTCFADVDVITRAVCVENTGAEPIRLQRVLSACVEIQGHEFDFVTLNGAWARERHPQRSPLGFGTQSVSSTLGETGHVHNNFTALVGKNATEDYGEAYGFALCYSGNFLAEAQVNPFGNTRFVCGINPFDFSWLLESGECFYAPEAILTYSNAGMERMSHNLHDFFRRHIIRGQWRDKRRPILINNWEATYFDFNTEKLIDIARESAEAGIEMLVMDDGWFGHRSDDTTSLGDWDVNEDKLAGGLKRLVDAVNGFGLKFGIWFEPEMVSPDSDLFRAHPDWCLHVPGRIGTQMRSQLVLDFSREDVREHVYNKLKTVLQSANIEYVKWDMNRQLTEVGNEILPPERQREIWHRYVLGVYDLQRRLTSDFPHLLLENCSGGGARFDAAMLCFSPQIWTSDDTDAIERLQIQGGTSLCYPCSCMGAHVSAVPNHTVGRVTPFATRGQVAMVGTFGYELDITKLSDNDKQAIKSQIAEFNRYNELVRMGDYYRLTDVFHSGDYDAFAVVAKDKSRVFFEYVQILNRASTQPPRIKLRGLNPELRYKRTDNGRVYSGAFLMHNGVDMPGLWGDFQSVVIEFTAV